MHDCGLGAGDVIVDATASDAVAACHALWLVRGIHVVTANKLGAGTTLQRATAIDRAQAASGAVYGDSATVGAGLPVLRSLRALSAGGDRIHSVEGVLSGSLAWLFRNFDGSRPFSALVRQARADGYTEPDPRIDLSGEDVRRKLLILARALGLRLESRRVRVESLVSPALAAIAAGPVDAHWRSLDVAMHSRLRRARGEGMRLRFVARLDVADDGAGRAAVGLHALPAGHPLCGGEGTDNCVAIRSCRYRHQSLLIQGPGAGVDLTAAALLDDVARIALPPAQPTRARASAMAAR
jgi:homoserine dehydrogenase